MISFNKPTVVKINYLMKFLGPKLGVNSKEKREEIEKGKRKKKRLIILA